MPADEELYLPVLVGATQNYREGINYQRDDEGENISDKNPYYNELTAMYWAWKNLDDVDAVGLVHYRRYFIKSKNAKLNNVLETKDIEKLFKACDVIVPQKRNYYIETNYSHYVHAHVEEPIDLVRRIIQKSYPCYLPSFEAVMKKRSAHMFNMFVMKKDVFNQYCKWLFDILFQLEESLDISAYSIQEARVFGYISELLLDVWLKQNQIDFVEAKWGQIGNKHMVRKVVSFLLRKVSLGSKKTHF